MADALSTYSKKVLEQNFANLLECCTEYINLLKEEFLFEYEKNNEVVPMLLEESWFSLSLLSKPPKGMKPEKAVVAFATFFCQDQVIESVSAASSGVALRILKSLIKWGYDISSLLGPLMRVCD